MADGYYMDLLIELECPICTNYMTPPIRQCATGHSICEDCRKKLSKCALCQGVFTESRNISLEGLAVKMRYPCINKNSGCNLKLAYNEREVHESKCLFKGYKCAMEKCTWVGRLEDIPLHWASKKNISKPYGPNNACRIKITSGFYYINLIEAFNRLFWFKCKLNNKMLYWAVQYIGDSAEAENYCYEIDIFKPDCPKHKILLSNYCHPVNTDNSVLFGGTCVSLPSNLVEPFLRGDQSLEYYTRVYAVKKNKSGEQSCSTTASEQKQRSRSRGPTNLEGNSKKSIKVAFKQSI